MKTLAAALMISAGLMSASAFADSNVEPNDTPFQGVYGAQHDAASLSRAQVEADLAQARANGLVSNVEPNALPFQGAYPNTASSRLSRADVQAQAVGLTSNVEPNDTPFVAQGAPARNDVLAAE